MMDLLKNKKILMISFSSFLQKFYQSLPDEIAKQSGAEVHVFVPPFWKEMWKDEVNLLEEKEDRIFHLHKGDIRFVGNLHFALFRSELMTLIKELQPDIIDLENEPFNLGAFQIIRLIKKYSPKSKFVIRASQNVFKKYPPPFNFVENQTLKFAKAILVRNLDAKNVLIRKGYSGQLELITHGVDVNVFKPMEKSIKCSEFKEKIVLGFIGSFEKHKGLNFLIEAAQNTKWKLLFIGSGSEKQNLIDLAQHLNVDLTIINSATHEEVVSYLSCMDIFVLPSITVSNWTEKFGRVLIEAMASGKVVLGSDSGEISKVIGEAGVIFKERNSADLREKIENTLSSKSLMNELQLKARQRVVQNYSWNNIARKTISVYKNVLDD